MLQEYTAESALQKQDLFDVLEVSHRTLSHESLPDLQQETLALMERIIGASSSIYGSLSQEIQEQRVIDGAEHGVPGGEVARWCDSYQTQDPFLNRYLNSPLSSSNHVVLSRDVVSDKKYEALPFYNEFLRPQSIYHIMLIGLRSPGGAPIGVIGLHRSKGEQPFSDKDAIKANLLAPCIRGAVERVSARERLSQPGGCGSNGPMPSLLPQRLQQFALSSREIDVVELLQKGLTDALIADQLCISVRTVSNHLRSIYEKTAVHNRTALLYRLTS